MIEAIATVVSCQQGRITVEYTRASACGHCQHESSCSISAVNEAESKSQRIEIDSELTLTTGQQVRIGIPEKSLVKGALLAYIVPLVCILIGAISGQYLSSGNDLPSIIGAFIGGIVGFTLIKWRSRSDKVMEYKPVILGVAIPIMTQF